MSSKHNTRRIKKPTEDAAIGRMSAENARMRKTLTVARLAIELCEDELRRR